MQDNASVLASSGGAAAIWESIRKTVGDSKNDPSKESVDKLKDLVQSGIEEAKKTSASDEVWSRSEGFGTEGPGGEQVRLRLIYSRVCSDTLLASQEYQK